MSWESADILLVEDNRNDAKLTMLALREANLCNIIETARDGEEALDFFFCRGPFSDRSFQFPPRLVLLDLKLPKVDGLEVLRALKGNERTQAIPVVMLTFSREESDLVKSYKLGANAHIQKPVEFDDFRHAVKQIGLFCMVVNEPPPAALFVPNPLLTKNSPDEKPGN